MVNPSVVICPMCGTENATHRCTHCGEALRSPLPPLGNRERNCDLCGEPVQFYLPLTLAANDCQRCEGEGWALAGSQAKPCLCLTTARLCTRCRDEALPVLPLLQSPGFYASWAALGYLLIVLSVTLWALSEFACMGALALALVIPVIWVVTGTEKLIRAAFEPEDRCLERQLAQPRFQSLLELLRTRNCSLADTNQMFGVFAPKINRLARDE